MKNKYSPIYVLLTWCLSKEVFYKDKPLVNNMFISSELKARPRKWNHKTTIYKRGHT